MRVSVSCIEPVDTDLLAHVRVNLIRYYKK